MTQKYKVYFGSSPAPLDVPGNAFDNLEEAQVFAQNRADQTKNPLTLYSTSKPGDRIYFPLPEKAVVKDMTDEALAKRYRELREESLDVIEELKAREYRFYAGGTTLATPARTDAPIVIKKTLTKTI